MKDFDIPQIIEHAKKTVWQLHGLHEREIVAWDIEIDRELVYVYLYTRYKFRLVVRFEIVEEGGTKGPIYSSSWVEVI